MMIQMIGHPLSVACVDVDNIGWISTHDFETRVRGSSDFSGIVDYFFDHIWYTMKKNEKK